MYKYGTLPNLRQQRLVSWRLVSWKIISKLFEAIRNVSKKFEKMTIPSRETLLIYELLEREPG